MSCCTAIIVNTDIPEMPEKWKVNGKCYLDLDTDFQFSQNKAALELNDLNEFQVETSLGFSLPDTPKNRLILDRYINPLSLEAGQRIDVAVMQGGCVAEFTRLCVVKKQDGSYEVDLDNDAETSWYKCAEGTFLNQLDLGEVLYDKPKIKDNWANDAAYVDDGNCYYFAMANYGKWLGDSSTGVIVEDFRPFFHITGLLQKALCECGVKFRSPFFETDFGRRLIAYLLDPNYSSNEDLLESRSFHATGEYTSNSQFECVELTSVQKNSAGNYDPNTGEYTANVISDFQFRLSGEMELVEQTDIQAITLCFVKKTSSGSEILWERVYQPDQFSANPLFFDTGVVDIKNVTLVNNESVCVQIKATDAYATVNGYFNNTPIKAFYSEGDTLPLAQLLDSEKTVLDLLKGAAHLIDGKINYDPLTNEVWLYTPNDTKVYEEEINGYYTDGYIDITDKVICSTGIMNNKKNEIKRYCLIRFQKSDDAFIKKLTDDRDIEEMYYSKLIDRGEGFEEDTEEKENPCFQPTANDFTPVPSPPIVIETFAFDLPQLLDNNSGDPSYDLGFRILYNKGLVTQQTEQGGTMTWFFEGQSEQQVPYAFQVPNAITTNGECEERLVYGTDENDLYNIAWEDRAARQVFVDQTWEVCFTGNDYKSISFRDKVVVFDGERTYSGRLASIDGADFCSNRATINIDSDAALNDLCKKELEVNPCDNRVKVDCESTDDEVSAAINNDDVNSPVTSQNFEYSTDGGSTWNTYGGGTISGEEEVIFRVITEYEDGCLSTTTLKRWKKVCDNTSEIICEFNDETFQLTITVIELFNSTVDSYNNTYSVDGTPIVFTLGDPIQMEGGEDVVINYVVNFDDSCPPIELTKNFKVPEKPDCQNFPEANLEKIEDCVYSLEMDYTNTESEVQQELIQIKINGRYINWNRQPINTVKGFEEIRILIYYCDCPPTCITLTKEDLI